jgi:L-amino acid N-acyltransferase YncA
MSSNPILRVAKPTDADAMLEIYAPYIRNTSFTFETEVPDSTQFASRIGQYLDSYPWLVYEVDNQVAGYAYAARHRERTAYQWSVEASVYVHDDFQRRGIATILYQALIRMLKQQEFRNVYAVINLPNEKSVTFHERLGFSWFATYEQVGYKLGKWKNVGWWRLVINEFNDEPAEPLKFSSLDKDTVSMLLTPTK